MSDQIIGEVWQTGSGMLTDLNTITHLARQHCKKFGAVFVGSDSHLIGGCYIFSTVICFHGADEQQGGRYFFCRYKRKRSEMPTLRNRLLFETENSLSLASHLRSLGVDNIEIHIDCSPPEATHKSGRSADSLLGFVTASGFRGKIKPESWAAQAIADKHAR